MRNWCIKCHGNMRVGWWPFWRKICDHCHGTGKEYDANHPLVYVTNSKAGGRIILLNGADNGRCVVENVECMDDISVTNGQDQSPIIDKDTR